MPRGIGNIEAKREIHMHLHIIPDGVSIPILNGPTQTNKIMGHHHKHITKLHKGQIKEEIMLIGHPIKEDLHLDFNNKTKDKINRIILQSRPNSWKK